MNNPLGKCRVLIGRLPNTSVGYLKTEPTGCSGLVCGVAKVRQGNVSVFLDDVGNLECYLNGKLTQDYAIKGL